MIPSTVKVGDSVAVEFWPENNVVMGFRVFELTSYGGVATYRDKRDDAGVEMTTETDHAEVFMSGSVKWDGCVNFEFPASEECMIHACSRESVKALFSEAFDLIYDLAVEMMPEHRMELE